MATERTAVEAAWAAGLFEGEGTWYVRGSSVSAALAMTDHDVVRRFYEVVGVGRLKDKPVPARYKPQLEWLVTDRAGIAHVLEMFRPWLGVRRLARGEEVLRLQAERTQALADARDRACKNGHPRTSENTYVYWHKQKQRMARACNVCRIESTRRSRRRRANSLKGDDG